MSDEYNGWTNRETWAIQLHLSNNQGDYEEMSEYARECLSAEYPVGAMADRIEDWTEEVFQSVTHPEDGEPSEAARMLVSDVGSYWRADFREIASHWIDEARESVAS